MAKIFYVVENAPDYAQVNFFKTEKEALEYGISELPQFDMYGEPMNDEEADGEEWYQGDSLTFKKGILFTQESGDVYVQAMEDVEAREYAEGLGDEGGAIFFEGFTKGMFGYLGRGTDGSNIKWDWDGYAINESIQERHITLKRRYTENHPAITVGKSAKIRNKMLEAVSDGKITQEEFNHILKEMSIDSTRWLKRNNKFFNVSEDGISLSTFGTKILKEITINEGRAFVAAAKKAKDAGETEFEYNGKKFPVTIKEDNKTKASSTFLHESFTSFVNSLSVNEAFKSMKLAQLLTLSKKSSWNKGIAQEFYNYTKVKLDLIEDHDLLEVDPQTAYKQKGGTKVKFFLIDNEKQSPYTEDSYDGRIQPGLIAVLNGNNDFMGAVYRRYSNEKGRILTKTDKADSLGVDKRRKGYGATGLSSAKRIADFADRAIVVDIDILRQRYSAEQQRTERAAAQKGAIAFKSDKEFKAENIARYNEILANKAAALPLDKMVKGAIDKLADQIKEGVAKGEKGRYGDIIIGKNSKGNEAKMRDASNHMSNILDDYGRYVQYIADGEKEIAEWGKENSYYAREAKTYAKNIKDKINQIDTFDYAW